MRNVILFAIAVSVANYADGRVYYLENLDDFGARSNDAIYPMVEQQASRDLDLAFSAGDPLDRENVVSPGRKIYTVVAPEKPYVESNRDADRPVAYYRLTEPATRRGNLDDVILVPQGGRKLMKLNGNNKGEVILELRVIANHDSA
ncbi:PREDICTED: uncharacterized protein LOC105562844 [Vollenhovia emeryi]|uniref:uncharacterized protein LOC105562844 n=1 Tax=Vollenhovia emeryi TaxID=411798 RepID=UPI0005F4EB4B|nr:PREDICTED: uncharacterized protein LOC105562844 [Vollenhovia emeryi]XP_011869345.1 PREDICTED: uncharacterized protein LOC105562844 [Vollenhovia emeryi]